MEYSSNNEGQIFLYIEDVRSIGSNKRRLNGIGRSNSVMDLMKASAAELGVSESWSGISMVYGGKELTECKFGEAKYEG